jgi:hypothetical protein
MELGCLVLLDRSLGGRRYEAELAWSFQTRLQGQHVMENIARASRARQPPKDRIP